MADPRGFLEVERVAPPERDPATRTADHHEIFGTLPADELREQGRRCMDCGIPFCHQGCPLGNLIPEWNDLVRRGEWRLALERLHATNNFPEFTGLICPAPCEAACVLAINDDPVMIKSLEWGIIERGFREGWVRGKPPLLRSRWSVGVVGSGPAGLACAEELNAAGHRVVVYERDEGPGGLIRLGVPDFKLEKWIIDRRVALLEEAGIAFEYGVDVGTQLGHRRAQRPPRRGRARARLAGRARDRSPGPRARRRRDRDDLPASSATVTSPGVGGSGAHRGGQARGRDRRRRHRRRLRRLAPTASARSRSPSSTSTRRPRARSTASWPAGRTSRSACGRPTRSTRAASAAPRSTPPRSPATGASRALVGDKVGAPPDFEPTGETHELPADLVLIAIGFTGVERGLVDQLDVAVGERGAITSTGFATTAEGVFACGDARRGQSLIVTAIAEGRQCAAAVERYLTAA